MALAMATWEGRACCGCPNMLLCGMTGCEYPYMLDAGLASMGDCAWPNMLDDGLGDIMGEWGSPNMLAAGLGGTERRRPRERPRARP